MKIIRCDRCGTNDDLHNREITVNSLYGSGAKIADGDHFVMHLCGYCTSRFKLFVAEGIHPNRSAERAVRTAE